MNMILLSFIYVSVVISRCRPFCVIVNSLFLFRRRDDYCITRVLFYITFRVTSHITFYVTFRVIFFRVTSSSFVIIIITFIILKNSSTAIIFF